MKKIIIVITAIFLVVLSNSFCLALQPKEKQYHKGHQHETAESQNSKVSGKLEDGIRVVKIKASRYKFEPDPIVVKLGEKVRLVVTSTDVAHGLAIAGFKVAVSVPAGETRSAEFIAKKKGIFHAHCSVYCGPGHGHMHARFIVKE